jgi:hypothetical protein
MKRVGTDGDKGFSNPFGLRLKELRETQGWRLILLVDRYTNILNRNDRLCFFQISLRFFGFVNLHTRMVGFGILILSDKNVLSNVIKDLFCQH